MRGFLVGAALAFVPALATTVSADATVWDFAQDLTTNGAQTGNGAGNAWWYFYADPGDRDGAYTLFTQPLMFGGGRLQQSGQQFPSGGRYRLARESRRRFAASRHVQLQRSGDEHRPGCHCRLACADGRHVFGIRPVPGL